MVESDNVHLMPMKGTVERETLRKAVAAKATRAVIEGMQGVQQRIPGQIGSVALPHELAASEWMDSYDPPPDAA